MKEDLLKAKINKLEKDNASYEQIFWNKDNEIAKLKKQIDRLKSQIVRTEEYCTFIKSCLKKENLQCMNIDAYFTIKEYIEEGKNEKDKD